MKLSRDDARKQGKRLQSCPMLAPQTEEGVKEIIDCLMRNCQSAEHAANVMTQVLDSALEVKGPITAWIASTARQSQIADQAPAGCDQCYLGPDMDTGEVRWAYHVPVDIGGYSRAARCCCQRGRWLYARDTQRFAEQPEEPRKQRGGLGAAADWAKQAAGDRDA